MAMQASESIEKPPAICLMGPTAAGKTQFAMDLSDRFTSTLINVDSAQISIPILVVTVEVDIYKQDIDVINYLIQHFHQEF